MKTALAVLNTTLSSVLIFCSLFVFGLGGGFRHGVGFEEILLVSIVPILTLGVISGWVAVFRPLRSLSITNWFLIVVAALFVSWLCISAALSAA